LLWYIKLRFSKKATKIWRFCGLLRIYEEVDGFWKRHKIRKQSPIFVDACTATTTDVKQYGTSTLDFVAFSENMNLKKDAETPEKVGQGEDRGLT
jgi:hypothetical protein